jgi:Transposase DDE domain
MPSAQKSQPGRNWKRYNHNLKKRGKVVFSFDKKTIYELYHHGIQCRGGIRRYSPLMFEYMLKVKIFLRLPWRATAGFVEGLLKATFPNLHLALPDYAHACREAAKLPLRVKQYIPAAQEGMEIAFDSTGINVYGTSGWHQRTHGKSGLYRQKEQWKKIHVALDLSTMQIQTVEYTKSNINDCSMVPRLCSGIKGKVKSIRADGAYDTKELYKIAEDWGAKAIIPPAITSKAQHELKKPPPKFESFLIPRDATLTHIRTFSSFSEGLKDWKQQSGYHKRSLIEAWMSRLKKSFGFNLQHKTEAARRNEVITKVNLLNLMVVV